jgi:hypothetical protein
MSRTSEHDGRLNNPTLPAEEDMSKLYLAYKQAFDEYSEAAFVVNDCMRRSALPTAEAFVRRRLAYVALLETSRAVSDARRRNATSNG